MSAEHGQEEETNVGAHDSGIGAFCLALCVGVICRAFLSKGIKGIKLPYTVFVLIFGLLIGGVVGAAKTRGGNSSRGGDYERIFGTSIGVWVNISPDVIFNTIIPILIFESSFSVNPYMFMRQIKAVLTLAVPAVILNTLLIGLFIMHAFPYGWGLCLSFAFGSMLAGK